MRPRLISALARELGNISAKHRSLILDKVLKALDHTVERVKYTKENVIWGLSKKTSR